MTQTSFIAFLMCHYNATCTVTCLYMHTKSDNDCIKGKSTPASPITLYSKTWSLQTTLNGQFFMARYDSKLLFTLCYGSLW